MFKAGDYVIVSEGVWDSAMPDGRPDALVVELVGPKKDQAILMFSNQNFLKFHLSQLTLIEKYSKSR
jgi:hypothetical protein